MSASTSFDPGPVRFVLSYQLSQDAFNRELKRYGRNRRLILYFILGFLLFCFVVTELLVLTAPAGESTVGLNPLLALWPALILGGLEFYNVRRRKKMTAANFGSLNVIEASVELADNGLTFTAPTGYSAMAWSSVAQLSRKRDHVHILSRIGVVSFVPAASFSPEAWGFAADRVREHGGRVHGR